MAACCREWSVQEVGDWLAAADLGHLRDAFRFNRVDGATLLALERDDLRDELGIEALADRKALWQHVQALQAANPEPPPPGSDAGTDIEAPVPAGSMSSSISVPSPGLPPASQHADPSLLLSPQFALRPAPVPLRRAVAVPAVDTPRGNGIARSVSSYSARSHGSSQCHPGLQTQSGPAMPPPSPGLSWETTTADFTWTRHTGSESPTSSAACSTDVGSDFELTLGGPRSRASSGGPGSRASDGGVRHRPPHRLRLQAAAALPEALARQAAQTLCRALVSLTGDTTPAAFASLLRVSQPLTERVLSSLLIGLGPACAGRDEELAAAKPTAVLPAAAVTLLRAYGVTTAVAGDLTLSVASAALRQPACALDRFVRDALRVCEGVSVPPKGGALSERDWEVVVQLLQLAQALPAAEAAAAAVATRSSAGTEKPAKSSKRQRLRLSLPAMTPEQRARAERAAGLVRAMAAPSPSVTGIARMLRHHGALLECMLTTLLRNLAPDRPAPAADAPLSSAAKALLRSYGVSFDERATAAESAPLTLAVAVDALRRCRGVDYLVRDALRVCEGIEPPERSSAPLSDADLATFVSIYGLTEPLLALAEAAASRSPASLSSSSPPQHLPPPTVPPPQPHPPQPRQAAAPQPAAGEPELRIGDEVGILAEVAVVKAIIAEIPRLGWQDDMERYCGTTGRVKRFDARDRKAGKVQVQHADLVQWTWPTAAVTIRSRAPQEAGVMHRLVCPDAMSWRVHAAPAEDAPVTHTGVVAGSEVQVTGRSGGWLSIAGGGWVIERSGAGGWRPLSRMSDRSPPPSPTPSRRTSAAGASGSAAAAAAAAVQGGGV
eukprot:TRINITY_DN46941_c0_g1_i1.p1 TRINITY_DN46941_c0_g1~~TRINITY_DN46941_c0_g1_i1.p1  ORF type:complete len:836 (+),score=143.22 TRINITY_DN46941_c0_g1_i1:119-2626(+)